tara:strand:+ start:507 stop:803 length:297 start_codon:yes stop_codon:yes gene_type:complete
MFKKFCCINYNTILPELLFSFISKEILQQLQVYTFTLFEVVEFCFSESNKRLLLVTVVDFTLSEKVAFSHPLLGHFIFCTIITYCFYLIININNYSFL